MRYSFECADYPGLEACPATFIAATEAELWKHIELHGRAAHDDIPEEWSDDERRQIQDLIRCI
jgi:predicted small metal-binding protein